MPGLEATSLFQDEAVSTTPPIPPVHVVSVTYKIVSDSSAHDFSKVEVLVGSLDGWTFHIETGALTAKPSQTFGSREDARADIEPRLIGWAQAAFLATSQSDLREGKQT